VVATWADADDHHALVEGFRSSGVKDSKQLHKPGDLAPLENVALAGIQWLCGTSPRTAAEWLACLGESDRDRDQPWMRGAEALRLPIAATTIPTWKLPGVQPGGCAGRVIHPTTYNRWLALGAQTGANKADLELDAVCGLLRNIPMAAARQAIIDRLGGRKFYRDVVASTQPSAMVLIEEESAAASRYRICAPIIDHQVAFLVGGEAHSPLTALSSCLAKYARELHMQLFNAYWCAQIPGLKPTAGYPEDAKRWLRAVGRDTVAPLTTHLIRGSVNW
jgi:ribonuclease HII